MTKYSSQDFKNDLRKMQKLISSNNKKDSKREQNGGATGERHFVLVELNQKPVDFEASATLKEGQTPLSAAKKMLKSIAHHRNLKGMNKLNLKVVFSIRETTRGSSKKVYGPYSGKYHKYTPEELKSREGAYGDKVKAMPKLKPVVKIYKSRDAKEFYNYPSLKKSVKTGGDKKVKKDLKGGDKKDKKVSDDKKVKKGLKGGDKKEKKDRDDKKVKKDLKGGDKKDKKDRDDKKNRKNRDDKKVKKDLKGGDKKDKKKRDDKKDKKVSKGGAKM